MVRLQALHALLDLLHIFKQFSEGQPCLPELDRAHVAQGRVDPRVVAGPHPLVDPLPQMLGVGKRLAVDEPPLQAVVGGLDHGVVVRAALLRQGPLDAEDLERLVYRGVGELASAVRVEDLDAGQGNPTVANAAFTRPESRPPTECPTISRLQGSTSRQT